MMYAITLYFDETTQGKIQEMIFSVSEDCGNKYMIENRIPPHITVAAVEIENEKELIQRIDSFIAQIKGGDINWASIGVFNPYVLFLAPVLNEYLQYMCKYINRQLNMFMPADNGHYLPNCWVPHTAIATKLSEDEIHLAFKSLQKQFVFFTGKATELVLAKCNSYKEVKKWVLV